MNIPIMYRFLFERDRRKGRVERVLKPLSSAYIKMVQNDYNLSTTGLNTFFLNKDS